MLAGRLIAVLTIGTSVVRRGEGADHKLSRLDGLHRAANFLDNAAVLVPHRRRLGNRVDSAVWPQVRTAHASSRVPDNCIRRLQDRRYVTLFETQIARTVEHSASHNLSPSPSQFCVFTWCSRASCKACPTSVECQVCKPPVPNPETELLRSRPKRTLLRNAECSCLEAAPAGLALRDVFRDCFCELRFLLF